MCPDGRSYDVPLVSREVVGHGRRPDRRPGECARGGGARRVAARGQRGRVPGCASGSRRRGGRAGLRFPRGWRYALVLAALTLGALVLLAWAARGDLHAAAGSGAPAVAAWWVVVAALVGPLAVLVYGEMHRQVLRAAGSDLHATVVQAVTVAGNAMSATLPAGGAASSVVWSARAMARRGVPGAAAAVTVATAAAVSTVVLICLVPVVLTAAGLMSFLMGAVLLAVGVAVVVAGGAAARSQQVLSTTLVGPLRVLARIPWPWLRRRIGADPDSTSRAWAAQLGPAVPGPRAGGQLMITAVAMYLIDFAALAAATRSVLPVVPWAALSVGWLVGQVGMALQLTPGGLGLVEAGLGGVLLTAGLPAPQAAVIVAVYRGASWLLPALLGWAVYLVLEATDLGAAPQRAPRQDLPRRRS